MRAIGTSHALHSRRWGSLAHHKYFIHINEGHKHITHTSFTLMGAISTSRTLHSRWWGPSAHHTHFIHVDEGYQRNTHTHTHTHKHTHTPKRQLSITYSVYDIIYILIVQVTLRKGVWLTAGHQGRQRNVRPNLEEGAPEILLGFIWGYSYEAMASMNPYRDPMDPYRSLFIWGYSYEAMDPYRDPMYTYVSLLIWNCV